MDEPTTGAGASPAAGLQGIEYAPIRGASQNETHPEVVAALAGASRPYRSGGNSADGLVNYAAGINKEGSDRFILHSAVGGRALGLNAHAGKLSTGTILVTIGCRSATLEQWRLAVSGALETPPGPKGRATAVTLGLIPEHYFKLQAAAVASPEASLAAELGWMGKEITRKARVLDAFLLFVEAAYDED